MPGVNGPAVTNSAVAPAGQARTPLLALDGFSGSLDRLLGLARGQRIDLTRLPLPLLVEQVAAALAWDDVPLTERADWLVMAAWLLQLRSRLLLPADAPARRAAEAAADRLRRQLLGLAEVQALASWLDDRPQLGRDVFARGAPEFSELLRPGEPELDVAAFLWACVDLFDADLTEPETAERYRPPRVELHSIPEARLRILRRLADAPDGRTLDQLLPDATSVDAATSATTVTATSVATTPPGGEGTPSSHATLRRRSAWTSTFVAGLELAKQGDVLLAQNAPFNAVHVMLAAALPAASNTG